MNEGENMNRLLTISKNFLRKHPPLQNVNELMEERITFGQRAADKVASTVGSWRFIIIQTILLMAWVVLNAIAWIQHWDPYPFILMNLLLSLQAAYAAPIIMMSQNRQAARDRVEAHNDYLVNLKSEEGIKTILEYLHAHNETLSRINEKLEKSSNITGN
jgi:uncharacterized membrane protein